jgi:hypothetical protein
MNTDLTKRRHDCVDTTGLRETDKATHTLEVLRMATERLVIPGIVKNGMVIPQNDTPLPEGAHVDILLGPADVTPELQAELEQWEKASDEAWAMIDQWEAKER